ncbi:unnamed protein product [Ectocarpus sp. CCAP 1310/34]|nr:unnamed protein product [Ectocarpus sp. CCAP 1310/34]
MGGIRSLRVTDSDGGLFFFFGVVQTPWCCSHLPEQVLFLGNKGKSTCVSALSPDTNLDASSASFTDDFLAAHHEQQPDWVVTRPPYNGALAFVKAALPVAKKGVALKLPLSFLEPCADRAGWLQANPPALCMMMSRARYQPAHVRVGEFWGVWYPPGSGYSSSDSTKLLFVPS